MNILLKHFLYFSNQKSKMHAVVIVSFNSKKSACDSIIYIFYFSIVATMWCQLYQLFYVLMCKMTTSMLFQYLCSAETVFLELVSYLQQFADHELKSPVGGDVNQCPVHCRNKQMSEKECRVSKEGTCNRHKY